MPENVNEPKPQASQPAAAGQAGKPAVEGQPGAGPAEEAASAPLDLKAIVQGLQDEIASLNDKLLRAHAEMDNMRKRAEREKVDTAKFAITRFATDIVAVGDNLTRALSSLGPAAVDGDSQLKAFVEGVTMTDRALVAALDRHGVKRIEPQGEPFNPHLHQAIAQVTNPNVPAGSIVQVHQCGYTIEERVLRPAMVVVAQGGFKPVKPPPAQPGETANESEKPAEPPTGA